MNHPDDLPQPADEPCIDVAVDVFRTAETPGAVGNTSSGRYRFVLSQDVVHVDAAGVSTQIVYRLTKDAVARGFSFIYAYATDVKYQLVGPFLSCSEADGAGGDGKPRYDTISYVHSNTHASLISISLQVEDHRAPPDSLRVAYDPQITNQPDGGVAPAMR